MRTRRRTAFLAALLPEILEPPVAEVGALPVDAFVPPHLRAPSASGVIPAWLLGPSAPGRRRQRRVARELNA
jgi:hypothetical protein